MPKRITLYLTAKERLLLERQNSPFAERCAIADEDHAIADSSAHRKLRVELYAPKHPVFRKLAAMLAREDCTEDAAREFLRQADFTDIGTYDMVELAFLLGPVGMTSLIFERLSVPIASEELSVIGELTELRRHLLFAQDDVAHSPSAV